MSIGLAWRYARGVLALRSDDVLLASFPRSGSTLFRFVVAHYALEGEGALSFERLNQRAPELGVSELARPYPLGGLPRLIKTHRPFAFPLGRPRAVHLVRTPLDALASYHRYWMSRVGASAAGRGPFLRDRRRGLPRWIRHTRSWTRRADVTVRYAALRADPAGAVGAALRALGVSFDPAALAAAAERSSAAAVQREEARAGVAGPDALRPGSVFVADRPTGEGARYFDEPDRQWAADQLHRAGLGPWAS